MTHTGDTMRIAQLTDGLRQVVSALEYFNIKLDALVLHKRGDVDRLGMIFAGAFPMLQRTDGKTDTRLNGIQFIDRFDA